ncbi:ATP-binding protein [Streptomyces iconiensis]|uniref:ATP-binding protein n=1 Tax=Streptomyces iconiensis TaxID=1384038 RepID=A0ABT6ZZ46_9ACTN|nr:ATP-binding protein [Streptomyces iconiensis]MDJ1133901.1 ATP-binding protein [Streptomyces iconiensis]
MHATSQAQMPITVRVFCQRFSATRRGARLARLLVLHQLDEWGHPYGSPVSEDVAAIVAELASNAVLHGRVPGRDFEVRMALEGAELVRVEVTDTRADSRPPASAAAPSDEAESGRGLLIVEALSTRWGVLEGAAPLKAVWAEVSVRRGGGVGGV